MSEAVNKAKYGYQKTYQDMLDKISSGVLNAYDIIFVEETYGCYVISPELQPFMVHARVNIYDSVADAAIAINNATDTYEGQVISVRYNDVYRGYIVNKNSIGFYITPLDQHPEPIDYDTLGNKPIVNLTGTLDSPIILNQLNNGIYAIDGQYRYALSTEATIYLSVSKQLFVVEKIDYETHISKITGLGVTNYIVTDSNTISSYEFVSTDEIKDYATIDYVDKKIAGLNYVTESEIKAYIEEMFNSTLGTTIDTKIDEKIDATLDDKVSQAVDIKIAESIASSDDISSLFL